MISESGCLLHQILYFCRLICGPFLSFLQGTDIDQAYDVESPGIRLFVLVSMRLDTILFQFPLYCASSYINSGFTDSSSKSCKFHIRKEQRSWVCMLKI